MSINGKSCFHQDFVILENLEHTDFFENGIENSETDDLPVLRKIPKNTQMIHFPENCFFRVVFGLFSKMVSLIELILSPLA